MTQRRFGLAARRAREQKPARPSVVPGPTHRDPQALAAELRELAAHPRAGSHSTALRELADAVARGSGLEVWAGGGLVAAYGGPDALAPGPDEDAARGRRLGALPTVLVFVPLLITWFGLGAAAWAYQRMRDAGSTAQGSFLTLWQQGFDGRLWPVLRFDMMALWTVLALSALATATLMRHRWEERDESERRLLSQRLSGALAQTQALAAGAAAASPGRFAAELQGAAERLRELLGQAATVQQCARDLIVQADGAAGRSVAATAALDSAADALLSGTAQMRTSTQSASAAAERVATGSRLLAESVESAVAALRTSVAESFVTAGRDAAGLIGAAGESVASRFDTVAAAAEARGADVAGHAAESMDRVGREVRDALTAARGSFAESTQLLGSAVDGLDRSLTALPSSLESSASEGAERIGMAYELAVAALATSLRGEVRAVAAELADRIEELREASADRQAAEHDLLAGRRRHEDRLGAAVAEFHDTLRTLTKALREAGLAVADGSRHPRTRDAAGVADTPGDGAAAPGRHPDGSGGRGPDAHDTATLPGENRPTETARPAPVASTPGPASPGPASPGAGTPGAGGPGPAAPAWEGPGTGTSGTGTPGTGRPGATTPGASTPGTGGPGGGPDGPPVGGREHGRDRGGAPAGDDREEAR
ncbi:hypothetical protein [Streptomyces erythrochromogenes]|uniref:hypothetical protein n=1 Tax=Streptomyces erythrochromogenes TaxID=285574 RepID=UPI003684CF2B